MQNVIDFKKAAARRSGGQSEEQCSETYSPFTPEQKARFKRFESIKPEALISTMRKIQITKPDRYALIVQCVEAYGDVDPELLPGATRCHR